MEIKSLSVDIETYSSVDLKKSGLYKYVQSPDFEVLLLAYSYNGFSAGIVDLANGETLPEQLVSDLFNCNIKKYAYNAAFEWYSLSKYFGTAFPETWLYQWRCTMIHGLYCGFPAGLAAVGEALNIAPDKKKMGIGKSLIKYFCTPCAPSKTNGGRTRNFPHHDPERWELFKTYCKGDVFAEMAVEEKLSAFPVSEEIRREWILDQTIGARGVRIDTGLMLGAINISETVSAELVSEAVNITGLQNPKSVNQLKEWLEKETDTDIPSLNKDTVSEMLSDGVSQESVRRVLELRQRLSKSSVKKYEAMANTVCDDGRARGLLQFYGAGRTGRWAGRLIQVQNLPRNYIDSLSLAREYAKKRDRFMLEFTFGNVPDTLSQLIRTAFIPSDGHKFVVADFSAIEARVIAWLAGESWRQEVFATHGKIYEASAAQMFGVPIEKITKGNPEYELRSKGKVAELALGYQGSVGALIQMGALEKGLQESELQDIVNRWRSANTRICDLWNSLNRAALSAVRTLRPAGVKGLVFAVENDYSANIYFMTVQLPSGRKLYYPFPSIQDNNFGRPAVTYSGTNGESKKWGRISTYGGKLTENVVQAIARDCLSVAVERINEAGYDIVMHIHDEVVIDCPDSRVNLEDVCNIMRRPILWAPGLLLNADGFVGDYYKKE